MARRCCVPGCVSNRNSVYLHKFPKTEIGLQKWVQCINSDYVRNLGSKRLQNMYVCHEHFEKRMTSGKFLCHSAYPSLFSREEIESGLPSTTLEASENTPTSLDHDYTRKIEHCDHTYNKSFRTPLTEIRPNHDNVLSEPSTSRLDMSAIDSGTENIKEPNEPQCNIDYSVPIVTPLKCKRQRVVQQLNLLSPKCRHLYRVYKSAKRQLDFATRAKKAMKMSKEKYFEKLTAKLNPLARKLFWMQIQQCTKNKFGRRYSDEEKLIALSILKQSPKSYRFLQKILILPSKDTLNKFISNLNIGPGINPQIFSTIRKEVENWQETKKYCSIIFDEVALEPGVSYDHKNDHINGFVQLLSTKNKYADHALVFMIRGALHKWQQPLCYYFCEGATSAMELQIIIKNVTKEVIGTGLNPVAFVADQGSAFRSAFNMMQEETRRQQLACGDKIDDTVQVGQHKISVVYDPPHLIKGLRNNFLNKNIIFDQKLCKWSDIVDVYLTDCKHAQARLLHKLTDEHVLPDKIKKMKVKNCARVFSKTVSAALAYTSEFSHYSDGRTISETLKNTSEVVNFFDDLFDSVNGTALKNKQGGKPLRTAVQNYSDHVAFWDKAIETLKNIKFINNNDKVSTIPSQKNFITTLQSLKRLWDFFKTKGCTFMRPRLFNSDPIENFFGQVRAYNFRNNDPSCKAFEQIFRSLLITRFINFHSQNFNCENTSGEQILKLKNLIKPTEEIVKRDEMQSSSCIQILESENLQEEARKERLNVHSRAYTVGWVIRKCLKNIKCRECTKNMCQKEISSVHKWISHREYKGFKNSQKLTYPSEYVVRSFGYIVKESNEYLETQPHTNDVTKSISNIIKSKYSFDFLTCNEHKIILLEYFLSVSIRLCVINWCSIINKILRGVDVLRLGNMSLPAMQDMAYNKYKKKLKNKKLNK